MISISLPSLYPDLLARTLANIRDTTSEHYQVVVVSPFKPPEIVRPGGEIVWVESHERIGASACHALAFRHMTGDFVTALADDHLYVQGWDTKALYDFLHCEKNHLVVGLLHTPNQVGTVFGWYYPYFPIMRMATARESGWFDPKFRMGWGDSDLALRIWAAGGVCRWSLYHTIIVTEDDNRKGGDYFHAADMQLFISRWKSRFGAGWNTNHIRGFNIDVSPVDQRWTDNRIKANYQPNERTIAPCVLPS